MQNVVEIFHRNAALPFIMAIDDRGPNEELKLMKLPIYRYIEEINQVFASMWHLNKKLIGEIESAPD